MTEKSLTPEERAATVAATELHKVNKKLSTVGIVSGALMICATVASLYTAHLQQNQIALQAQQLKLQNDVLAEQKAERNRVHGVLDLVPEVQPEGLFVNARFKNESGRVIHPWMLGIRIFRAKGFVSGTTVKNHPELLLHAESSIDECPEALCPPGGKSTDRVYNHAHSGGSVSLAPGAVYERIFGPYPISESELKAGIRIQGWVQIPFCYAIPSTCESGRLLPLRLCVMGHGRHRLRREPE